MRDPALFGLYPKNLVSAGACGVVNRQLRKPRCNEKGESYWHFWLEGYFCKCCLVLSSDIVHTWYFYGRLLGSKSLKPSGNILKVLGFEVSFALGILSVLGHSVWFCCISLVHKMRTSTSLLSIYSVISLRQASSLTVWIYNALHNRV